MIIFKIKKNFLLNNKNNKVGQFLRNKIEHFKLHSILKNKNNILFNDNISFYLKYYLLSKKNNIFLINITILLKKLKKILSFLVNGISNYIIFFFYNKLKPGFITNWLLKKDKNVLFPNSTLFVNNLQIKNDNYEDNIHLNIKLLNEIHIKNDNSFEISLSNLYCFNELKNLNIFSIILTDNFKFYQFFNNYDNILILNLKNTEKFLFYNIFLFCDKFSKISKILYFLFKQKNYYKINKKLNSKYTHYWTRTNTLKKKIKNRF